MLNTFFSLLNHVGDLYRLKLTEFLTALRHLEQLMNSILILFRYFSLLCESCKFAPALFIKVIRGLNVKQIKLENRSFKKFNEVQDNELSISLKQRSYKKNS